MTRSFGEYTRLAKGVFGCSSLWAGREHLLYVRGTGILWPVNENYRRIRYADITALTAAPSPGSILWLSLSAAWIFLFTAPAVVIAANGGTSLATVIILSIFAALALPFLIYNLVRGRTCIYAIETDSGILKIRPANRLKVARRISPEIADHIARDRDSNRKP